MNRRMGEPNLFLISAGMTLALNAVCLEAITAQTISINYYLQYLN